MSGATGNGTGSKTVGSPFNLFAAALALVLPAQAMAQDVVFVRCTWASGVSDASIFFTLDPETLRLDSSGFSRWWPRSAEWSALQCVDRSSSCEIETSFTDSSIQMTVRVTYDGGVVQRTVFGINRLTGLYTVDRENGGGVPRPPERIEQGRCEPTENPAAARKF